MGIKNFGFETVETYLQKGSYYIPDYQREYSWSIEQEVDDFWTDLENAVQEDRESHFFGQVVIHDSVEDKNKYVIDGQQRTSTSIILLAVMRDIFEELSKNTGHAGAKNKYEDIRLKFIGRWEEEENELRLTLGNIDNEYFRDNIQIGRPDRSDVPDKSSHKRIKDAYFYFEEQIRERIDNLSDVKIKYDKLLQYYNKFLKGFKLMYLETDEINEAFIIFETLNARGKDLETSDLLKNHLFRTSGKTIDTIKNTWMKTVENLENIDITKFLRHYWNSKFAFTREKDLYKKIRDYIDTPKKCDDFTKNFFDMSDVYKALVNPKEENFFTDQQINEHLSYLKIINASSFYPTLLSMQNNNFSEKDIRFIVSAIETLFFRNCVVADKVANKYELLFARIAYQIEEKEITTVSEIYTQIKKETLSDEEFQNAFKIFTVKSASVAKYVLREINDFKNKEMKILNDNSKIHLEHIMPKARGDWEIDEEVHSKFLNRIGNLTLVADEYNRSMQNKLLDKKKEVYAKSKIAITNSLCKYNKWDQDTIETRQTELFETAKDRWKLY